MTQRDNANAAKQKRFFFEDGLQFGCVQCGRCCTGEPGAIYVTDREIDEISSYLGMPRKDFVRCSLKKIGGRYSIRDVRNANWSCLFFSEGKCVVYPVRPVQCRTWPFWTENLRSRSSWAQTSKDCPGIGSGKSYSRDEIVARMTDSD